MRAKTVACISKCILVIPGVLVPRGSRLAMQKRRNKGNSLEKWIWHQALKTEAYPGGGKWWENLADQQNTGFHQSQIKKNLFYHGTWRELYQNLWQNEKTLDRRHLFSPGLECQGRPFRDMGSGLTLCWFPSPWWCLYRKLSSLCPKKALSRQLHKSVCSDSLPWPSDLNSNRHLIRSRW